VVSQLQPIKTGDCDACRRQRIMTSTSQQWQQMALFDQHVCRDLRGQGKAIVGIASEQLKFTGLFSF
jgi:hypothetical protein